MMPSNVLPMMASSEHSTMAADRDSASSSRLRSVMSRAHPVKSGGPSTGTRPIANSTENSLPSARSAGPGLEHGDAKQQAADQHSTQRRQQDRPAPRRERECRSRLEQERP